MHEIEIHKTCLHELQGSHGVILFRGKVMGGS